MHVKISNQTFKYSIIACCKDSTNDVNCATSDVVTLEVEEKELLFGIHDILFSNSTTSNDTESQLY